MAIIPGSSPTLPAGSSPYATQLYKDPSGNIWTGTSAFGFFQVGKDIDVDAIRATANSALAIGEVAQEDIDALELALAALTTVVSNKVDKITGKGLSTEDYTSADKTRLSNTSGTNTGDQDLSPYATNIALSNEVTRATIAEEALDDRIDLVSVGIENLLPGEALPSGVDVLNLSVAGIYPAIVPTFSGLDFEVEPEDLEGNFVQAFKDQSGFWHKKLIEVPGLDAYATKTEINNKFSQTTTFNSFAEQGFYNTSGVFTSNANWKSTTIYLPKQGRIQYTVYGGTGANVINFFDASNVYISGIAFPDSGIETGTIDIPVGAVKATASTLNASIADSSLLYTALFDSVIDAYDFLYKTAIQDTEFPDNGFYNPSGVYNTSASWRSKTMNIAEDVVINYTLNSINGAALITFFNASNVKISSINASNGSLSFISGTIISPTGTVKAVLSTNTTTGLGIAEYSYLIPTEDVIDDILDQLDSRETIITVSKTATPGPTTFNTISSALSALDGDNEVMHIMPGVYEETGLIYPEGIDQVGVGLVEIRGYLPVTSTNTQVTNISTIEFYTSGKLTNIKATAKNCRYPVHADFSPVGTIKEIFNCWFVHYGTSEVYDERVSTGGDFSTIWRANSAFGDGLESGETLTINTSILESVMRSFSTHNNANYNLKAGAAHGLVKNSKLISYGIDRNGTILPFKPSVFVQSLNSKTDDTITLTNNIINGDLVLQTTNSDDWREFTIRVLGSGNSRHMMQIRHTCGSGYSMQYQTTDRNIFIIKVVAANTSEVIVYGNLLDSLMGQYSAVKGSVGLNSYVKSKVNATVAFANVNAYSGAKTITFVAGSDTKTISLSGGYANADALINDLNAKFGAGSFVASLYWSGLDWYPEIAEEIQPCENKGTTAILRGRAVKVSGYGGVALMTSADSASLFYGIAVQDIPVGGTGDVKHKGYMLRIWADGLEATTLADGDQIKVESDGRFAKATGGVGTIVTTCIANENIQIGTF